jgi:hypothetical protein
MIMYVAPAILTVGTGWKSVTSFTPRRLVPGERDPGTHCVEGWVGLDALEKRKSNPDSSTTNPVA